MNFIKKLIKWLLIVALTLFVLLIVLGLYLEKSGYRNKKLANSPIIQELEALEKSQDYNKLVEKMVLLIRSVNKREARNIVWWLDKRKDSGAAPYLYLRVLFLAKSGRRNDTFEAYELAKLTARLDEIRCNNEESKKAKIKYESGYWLPFELAISKRSETHKKADRVWAYHYEQEQKDRPIAQWVCTNNYESKYDISQAMPDNEWQEKRSDYRVNYFSGSFM